MVLRVIGGIALVLGVVGVGFLVSMRTKYAPVQNAIRRMNRAVWNPQALRNAGTEGAPASVVRHRGRTTGTEYETPVGAYLSDGAILIALPYGATTDWIKNLRAAGGGEVVHEGRTYAVGSPEIVPMADIAALLSHGEQRTFRIFKVDEVLRLPIVSEVAAAT